MSGREHCEPLYGADGEVVAVARVSGHLTDRERALLGRLVEAAREAYALEVAADPDLVVQAEESRRRIAERNQRLRGEPG